MRLNPWNPISRWKFALILFSKIFKALKTLLAVWVLWVAWNWIPLIYLSKHVYSPAFSEYFFICWQARVTQFLVQKVEMLQVDQRTLLSYHIFQCQWLVKIQIARREVKSISMPTIIWFEWVFIRSDICFPHRFKAFKRKLRLISQQF